MKFVILSLEDQILNHGEQIDAPFVVRRAAPRSGENGKTWEVDVGFPQRITGKADVAGSDEGSCALLTGLIRSLRPEVVLETGTHLGRSTKAIASGLVANMTGHLWTLDIIDYGAKDSGALSEMESKVVTFTIGKSPDILDQLGKEIGKPIEFAYLDGGHEFHELEAELEFVQAHAADGCVIAVDNALDDSWASVREALDAANFARAVTLRTMCGMEIIQL